MTLAKIVGLIGTEIIPLGMATLETVRAIYNVLDQKRQHEDGTPLTDDEIVQAFRAAAAPWQRIEDRAEKEVAKPRDGT